MKEGIIGINRIFGMNIGFLFIVIYGIWYQCLVQVVYKGCVKKGDIREHDESERVIFLEIIQDIINCLQYYVS